MQQKEKCTALHNYSHVARKSVYTVNKQLCPSVSPSGFSLMIVFHPFCLQDGFVEFFQVADPESTVRNTLMAFAGVAGIGATLALLIR